MWQALRQARDAVQPGDYGRLLMLLAEEQVAFHDWQDHPRLPHSVEVDQESDVRLLYVNNTIYAQITDLHDIADSIRVNFPRWKLRGTTLKVTTYICGSGAHRRSAPLSQSFYLDRVAAVLLASVLTWAWCPTTTHARQPQTIFRRKLRTTTSSEREKGGGN